MKFCDGLARRKLLQIGAAGSLTLPGLLNQNALGETFGSAKRMILLFMWGGPAHQDIWDLKPNGPQATRGEFLPIATNVPGIQLSEHIPLISRHAEKLAIIRSVGQEDNNHSTGAHAGLTGRRHDISAENFGARDIDFPHFGSVVSHLNPNPRGLPTFVGLPQIITTTNGPAVPGQFAGILGKKYDPFQVTDKPDHEDFRIPTLTLPEGVSLDRLEARRSLLTMVDEFARDRDSSRSLRSMGAIYEQAMDIVLSSESRRAFDLSQESEAQRHRYGWHTFGQGVLLARRLIEAGVKIVTVYWHNERKGIDSSWDTHHLNFQELKNRLLPSIDRPIAALLEDLEAKGLLDETLVVWNSEFGRTPTVNARAGRDHWGYCNSVVMAGGGVPGGQVFGTSDEKAAYPIAEKVTQDDIAATIYHLMGYDPEHLIHDRQNRPYPLALGQPIWKLLGGEAKADELPAPAPLPRVEFGEFHQMLKERGNRYLTLNFGNPESEKDWQLSGFGPSEGEFGNRSRQSTKETGEIVYRGIFHPHFDFGWVAFRAREPQDWSQLKLSINGIPITPMESSSNQEKRRFYQIPLKTGFINSQTELTLQIKLPSGWNLIDLALTGDEMLPRHLGPLNS